MSTYSRFTLHPLTPSPSDAHAAATCLHASFAADSFTNATYPHTSILERIRDLESRWVANYFSPTTILVSAVHLTDAGDEMVVGYAKWEAPNPEVASEIRGELFKEPPVPERGANLERRDLLGLNDDLAEESTERMVSVHNGYLKGREVLKLALLAMIPQWRGKGVGTSLVNWGLLIAVKLGHPVWVDASPMSLSLYKKLGFVIVGRSEHELGVGTARGVMGGRYVHTGMVKEVSGKTEENHREAEDG
ncbi:hypothetical protein MMC10_011077 [Thelotrema lepadinum]|nr:hypothetical protein [Thelotrema lepadinum]